MAYNGTRTPAMSDAPTGTSDARRAAIKAQEGLEDIKDRLQRLAELQHGSWHNFDEALFKIRRHVDIVWNKITAELQEVEERAMAKHLKAI